MNTNENSSIESAASALTLKGTVGFLALIGFFTVTAFAVVSILWRFSEISNG